MGTEVRKIAELCNILEKDYNHFYAFTPSIKQDTQEIYWIIEVTDTDTGKVYYYGSQYEKDYLEYKSLDKIIEFLEKQLVEFQEIEEEIVDR